jgi:hypothetical protein
MNDSELSTMVCESVAGMHSSTPVGQIISRGHAVRAWRRVPAATAGALVVAGGAALGVTALAPGGHPAPAAAEKAGSQRAVVALAAWTVVKQANGDIDVTIRQLQHPVQLQATLRADGLPAHVSFSGNPGSVCKPHKFESLNEAMDIYRFFKRNGSDFLTINPSVLPSGVGLSISSNDLHLSSRSVFSVSIGTVYTSRQCTG